VPKDTDVLAAFTDTPSSPCCTLAEAGAAVAGESLHRDLDGGLDHRITGPTSTTGQVLPGSTGCRGARARHAYIAYD